MQKFTDAANCSSSLFNISRFRAVSTGVTNRAGLIDCMPNTTHPFLTLERYGFWQQLCYLKIKRRLDLCFPTCSAPFSRAPSIFNIPTRKV